MLNVFPFFIPSLKKPDTLLFTWGLGIFFSVTFFLSEALTKSTLKQSIKNPFYISGWKVVLRSFIFLLLLIFSIYLTGFNEKNLLYTIFVNFIMIILSVLIVSLISIISVPFRKKNSLDFRSNAKLVCSLYMKFVYICFTAALFFCGSITIYKWLIYGSSAVSFISKFDFNNFQIKILLILILASTILAYLVLIDASCDLFIKFTKLLYDNEKCGTYWKIFYTDPSQEKSVSDITTKEIIKDPEGYYRIPDSNGSGITQMIPLSSIVRIDEYKKSSDISTKTGKKKIQKQQRNKSRKPRNLKELMIFFKDENFSLGKSEQRIVQIIQFFYDFSILIFSLVFSRLEIENLRIFIALIMISIFLKVLIQQKISLSLIFKEYFRNLLLIIICNLIAIQITGDSKLATNLIDGIATLCYFLPVLILTAFFFRKADPVKYRLLTFALLIGSILSSFYILIFKERVHELVIAIIISTVVSFFDHFYDRYFGKI